MKNNIPQNIVKIKEEETNRVRNEFKILEDKLNVRIQLQLHKILSLS